MTPSAPRPGLWLWLGTLSLAFVCFALLIARPAHAQQETPRLKTESPYFFVKSDDPEARPPRCSNSICPTCSR